MRGEIVASSIEILYRDLLWAILKNGDEVAPRGIKTREIRGMKLVLTNPNDNVLLNVYRKPNYSFMVAEWLWIMTGCALSDVIRPFNKGLTMAVDRYGDERDQPTFAGAYGPKWIEQLPYVLQNLTADPDSRQAVVNIWRDRPRASADTPCTLSWQFFIRNDKVEMHTTMRSNDAWLGVPYDIFNFTQIQRWVAWMLGKDVGAYVHHVGSLHLYERDFEKAELAARVDVTPYLALTRFAPISKMPDLGVLSMALGAAAQWRTDHTGRFNVENAMLGSMEWLAELSVDPEAVLLPVLLMISTERGAGFAEQHLVRLKKIAVGTPWYDVLGGIRA